MLPKTCSKMSRVICKGQGRNRASVHVSRSHCGQKCHLLVKIVLVTERPSAPVRTACCHLSPAWDLGQVASLQWVPFEKKSLGLWELCLLLTYLTLFIHSANIWVALSPGDHFGGAGNALVTGERKPCKPVQSALWRRVVQRGSSGMVRGLGGGQDSTWGWKGKKTAPCTTAGKHPECGDRLWRRPASCS